MFADHNQSDKRVQVHRVSHLEDFHLEAAIRRGPIGHLQGLDKRFCELLHHREDQRFGCTLHPGQ